MSALRLTTSTFRAATRSLQYMPSRQLHLTRALFASNSQSDAGVVDGLSDGSAKGVTGGGEPLESSSKNAAPKPKITNASIPGSGQTDKLTEEQKKEVEEHNRDFEKKHDRGNPAEEDKVDKKFWTGGEQKK